MRYEPSNCRECGRNIGEGWPPICNECATIVGGMLVELNLTSEAAPTSLPHTTRSPPRALRGPMEKTREKPQPYCLLCGDALDGNVGKSRLCPDCLKLCMADEYARAREQQRKYRGPKNAAAAILLTIWCLVAVVAVVGWIYQGILALRAVFG